MSPELVAILAVGVTIAGLILNSQRAISQRLDRLEQGHSDLRERMARLEGLFEGFTKPRQPEAAE
ncbi:MAG: hypothetical protein OXH92_16445 [Bryobacterales bacterium]|nr:hypothetical protein [Bryobacterales bacterium]